MSPENIITIACTEFSTVYLYRMGLSEVSVDFSTLPILGLAAYGAGPMVGVIGIVRIHTSVDLQR